MFVAVGDKKGTTVMRFSSAFWILLLIFASLGIVSAQTVQTKESQAAMTPDKALERLKEATPGSRPRRFVISRTIVQRLRKQERRGSIHSQCF